MLPDAASALLRKHLADCPLCRQRVAELKALQLDLRALPSPVLGFDLGARLDERLNAAAPRKRPAASLWLRWLSPAGVSLLALASGVWLGGLLLGGGAQGLASASLAGMLDPVPPGGLCSAAELCQLSRGKP
jgi:anti-sigma factor RsiW